MHSKEMNSCSILSMNQGKVAGTLTVTSVLLCTCFISPSAIKAMLGTPRSRRLPSMETSSCSSGLGLKLIICNPVFKDKFLADLFSTIVKCISCSVFPFIVEKHGVIQLIRTRKLNVTGFLTCILINYLT
jgi:hypothetical protein